MSKWLVTLKPIQTKTDRGDTFNDSNELPFNIIAEFKKDLPTEKEIEHLQKHAYTVYGSIRINYRTILFMQRLLVEEKGEDT